jgi:alpha-glucosidase
MTMTPSAKWWKRGIIYQIYPRSCQDTDGDGVGDLAGIRERLPYFHWLGVDALWISPIFPSPMADFGYDVSNYCDIDPLFGTLADFDILLAESHRLGLKLILDFVPNHTSDRHPWFLESRASRDNPRRDWYLWRDPKPDGGPPNNWISNFGGSAWEFDRPTGQYYYHAFLKEQPDLNWRNPAVREAMHGALRFWLDRGVDGFRVDVIWLLIKDAEFRDNPPNPAYHPGQPEIERLLQVHSADQPEVHDVIAEMRSLVDSYPDRVLIGEIYLPLDRLVTYYGKNLSGADLPFNFQLIRAAWNAKTLAAMIRDYEAAIPPGGWPNWVLGNHDQHRLASRVGADQARIAAMLLLTLRGTPTMYYGDEIGMTDVQIPPELAQDPWELNERGLGVGRDPERTPMQWDESVNAGFTKGRPWLPISPDAAKRNVERMTSDRTSILTLYRDLIELRRRFGALSVGSLRLLSERGDVLAYERSDETCRLQVFLNLSRQEQTPALAEDSQGGKMLMSTHGDRNAGEPMRSFTLRPSEGVLIMLPP